MEKVQPVRLAYKIVEPVNGVDPSLAPIIFLHGLTASKEHWRDIPQLVVNALRRKAYVVDARNHGDSDWSDCFNFDINADDIIHFMDTAGIRKAILVGQSMGGSTAIKTALKWPDRVEKMISEDMVVRRISKEVVELVLSYVQIIRKAIEGTPSDLDEDGVKSHIINYFLTANLPADLLYLKDKAKSNPEGMKFAFQLCRGTDGRFRFKANLEVIAKSLQNYDTLSQDPQGSFEGPACFIYGTLSFFKLETDQEYIRQFFPNATFIGIEGATHDVHSDKKQETVDAMIKFIS